MKRLCIFYKNATEFIGKNIQWIVCQECQKRLRNGEKIEQVLKPYGEALQRIEDWKYESMGEDL
jgi:hypothetical protein